MGFDTDKIEEIRNKADIVSVIGEHITLKRKGVDHVACCPFHDEKTPSFKVNPQKRFYKCFGCGKSGDVISFLQDYQKLSFPEAVQLLAGKYGIDLPDAGAKREFDKPPKKLAKLSEKFIDGFANKRGISNMTLLRAGITESVEWMPIAEKEVPVICFNYYQGDDLINIKYRAQGKDMRLHKNAKLIFYNINALEGQTEIIITEGEIDCLSFIEAEIYNVVSVPNGAAKGVQKLEYIDNCWQAFSSLSRIIIAVDNDEMGRLLQEEIARRLGKGKCWLAAYPEDNVIKDAKTDQLRPCKDANEVLIQFGIEGVKKMYAEAKQYPLLGESTMFDLEDDLDNMYENGYPAGYDTGIRNFDPLLKFHDSQLTIVTGIPGHGKDEFVNHLCVSLSKKHGWVFGMFGFEETPKETATKIMEKYAGKAFEHRRELSHRMSWEEYRDSKLFCHNYFKFIATDEIEISVPKILDKATELVQRYGINGLVISPWASIEHAFEKGESETSYISKCLGQIISFCRRNRVHCFLLAHPTKVPEIKDKPGIFKVPTLYNISGSANFYNKTHNGITVYRNFKTNQTDVHVQKVKFYWQGKVGVCSFAYDTMTRQYTPLFFNEENNKLSNYPPPVRNYSEPLKSEFDDENDIENDTY